MKNSLAKIYLSVIAALIMNSSFVFGMMNDDSTGENTHTRTHRHVIDSTVGCEKGQFKFSSGGSAFYVEPNKPAKPPTQSVQVYNEQPQIFPAEEKVLLRLQPGRDGRTRIQETTQWPYLLNGQLHMQYSDGRIYGGSGILVGPHHILTAGHNVYDVRKQEWANTISVRLGLNKKVAPFGEAKVIQVYTFRSWVEQGNPNYDMALVVLNRSIGHETGWCGLLCVDDETLSKETVAITGYPGDKGFNKMMTMSHRVQKVESEKLYYDIDTYGGQSGSGIRIDKWGSPYVVGIHTLGEGGLYTGNSGVRLSQIKFDKIIKWISESLILPQSRMSNSPQINPTVSLPSSQNPYTNMYHQTAAGAGASTQKSPNSIVSDIVIPEIARGYEDIYERFLKGVLVYRPTEGSDVGKIELPIAALTNPLGSTFDLSSCGDTSKYLSIATGYRKVQTPANAGKVEIWFTPRFLVDKEMPQLAQNHHIRAISGNWDASRAPIGIFWTWGGWNAVGQMAYCDYLTVESMDEMGSENLLKKHMHCAHLLSAGPPIGCMYRRSFRAGIYKQISHFVCELK